MVFRQRIPKINESRSVTFRAWLPRVFQYNNEWVVVWLEKLVREQRWSGNHWHTDRTLTVADAALEKLNPSPAQPAPSPPSNMPNCFGPPGQALGGLYAQSVQSLLGIQQQQVTQQQLAQMLGQSQSPGSP